MAMKRKIDDHNGDQILRLNKSTLEIYKRNLQIYKIGRQNIAALPSKKEEPLKTEQKLKTFLDHCTGRNLSAGGDLEKYLKNLRNYTLSSDQLHIIENLLKRDPCSLVLSNLCGCEITIRKILCLRPGYWLNDEIINFYMVMLQRRHDRLVEQKQRNTKFLFENSFLMATLFPEESKQYSFGETLKRRAIKKDVLNQERIFIPINISNTHWTLLIIFLDEKKLCYYNSLKDGGSKWLNIALTWLKDVSKEIKGADDDFNIEEWKLIESDPTNVPQQHNIFDCGVFTIYCADYISDDLPLTYNQDQMPMNRKRICQAILNCSLPY